MAAIDPAPAAAEVVTEEASAGAISATLTDYNDERRFSLWLTVVRDGSVVWDEPVRPDGCRGEYCNPGGLDLSPSLAIADFNGDGEPEIALTVFTGGTHCCFYGGVYRRGADGGYRFAERLFGDPLVKLRDLDEDDAPEFVTADRRFAYRFTSYADSASPLRIWAFDAGRFVDCTSLFPGEIRADTARLWRIYRRERNRGKRDVRGVFAAWAADAYALGRGGRVNRELRRGVRRNWFEPPPSRFDIPDPWLSGRRYSRLLLRFLERTGYR